MNNAKRELFIFSYDDVKNKKQEFSYIDRNWILKPRWSIDAINQLNVIGLDLQNLHPDTKLSPEHKELLRTYGAIVN